MHVSTEQLARARQQDLLEAAARERRAGPVAGIARPGAGLSLRTRVRRARKAASTGLADAILRTRARRARDLRTGG